MQSDTQFLNRRRCFTASWTPMFIFLFLIITLLLLWLGQTVPSLINPAHVHAKILSGKADPASLELAALALPFATLAIFLVVAGFIGFGYSVIAREKRYLRIIDHLEEDGCNGGGKISAGKGSLAHQLDMRLGRASRVHQTTPSPCAAFF